MKKATLRLMRVLRDRTPNFWDWLTSTWLGVPICNLWDYCADRKWEIILICLFVLFVIWFSLLVYFN